MMSNVIVVPSFEGCCDLCKAKTKLQRRDEDTHFHLCPKCGEYFVSAETVLFKKGLVSCVEEK
jgi:hypothetical protein